MKICLYREVLDRGAGSANYSLATFFRGCKYVAGVCSGFLDRCGRHSGEGLLNHTVSSCLSGMRGKHLLTIDYPLLQLVLDARYGLTFMPAYFTQVLVDERLDVGRK